MTRFNFGSVVVVEGGLVGVVVKSWESLNGNRITHNVYVRSFNLVKEYAEPEIQAFVYDSELSEEDMSFYE